MNGKNSLPIYSWIDDVDDETFVVIARCFVAKRGVWQGMAIYTLVDKANIKTWERYKWRALGEERLLDVLRKRGSLPVICHVQGDGAREWGLG